MASWNLEKMTVEPTFKSNATGIPDYYKVYENYLRRYNETKDQQLLSLAYHYARVAEEFGQVKIPDEISDFTLFNQGDIDGKI